MSLFSVPLDVRIDAAVGRVRAGDDPHLILAAVVWPSPDLVAVGEYVDFCKRGHPRTEENTYIRPSGSRQCRVCSRAKQESRERWREKRRATRKVPCAYCGEPATAPSDKGTGGLATPRCRACFMAQLKERKRWSA